MLTERQKLQKIDRALFDFALGDINFISDHGKPVAGFILCYCFIDQLAHLRYGKDISKEKNWQKFQSFVDDYINPGLRRQYNSRHLWEDLRNKLIHNYSLGKSYSMADGRSDDYHLTEQQGTKVLFLKNFIEDIKNAFLKFRGQIAEDPNVRKLVLDWFDDTNIITDNRLEIRSNDF
jgi:hypothetical protein